LLCWNLNPVVQKFRGEVCSVWPTERVEFWMDGERLEDTDVLEWFEDLAIEFIGEINVAFRSIREADVYDKIMLVLCRNNFRYHGSTVSFRQACVSRSASLR